MTDNNKKKYFKRSYQKLNPNLDSQSSKTQLPEKSQFYPQKSPDHLLNQRIYYSRSSVSSILYYTICGTLSFVLLIVFFCCLHKLCRNDKTKVNEKPSFRSKKQRDLRNGKQKKKHIYDPQNHMNTRDREEERLMKEKSNKNNPVVVDNNQYQDQSQINYNLKNNTYLQCPKDSMAIRENPNNYHSLQVNDEKNNHKVNTESKKTVTINEPLPTYKVSIPILKDNIQSNKLQNNTKEIKNLENEKDMERIPNNIRSLNDIKLKKSHKCTCSNEYDDKKTIAFTTTGRQDKWETVNENNTVSNFSFQISSRNST